MKGVDTIYTYDISRDFKLSCFQNALAYATTTYKAQGSEYPIVVMPVLMTHYVMLQRSLVYTGITRAKKLLVIVDSKKALAQAILGSQWRPADNDFIKHRLLTESSR